MTETFGSFMLTVSNYNLDISVVPVVLNGLIRDAYVSSVPKALVSTDRVSL